ncbi:hypothetical protein KZO11_33430 [Streptomyces anulatus]|uniref:hypothetical protein n=1 Tax=Streptomyces anulatus TaxID=1892 RepID=UPI001C5F29F9|nr:hypothetical protein [Streptomyces anulatus]QYA98163.1 hypothetical protein KZO11_33430 [Streptomyces anulatus]
MLRDGTCPQVTAELRENGERVNHKRAVRVMRSITPPESGWFLCLATVIDLASRHPTGRPIADHLRTDLVIDALTACGYGFVTVPQLLVPAGLSRARSTAEPPGPAAHRRCRHPDAPHGTLRSAASPPPTRSRPCRSRRK